MNQWQDFEQYLPLVWSIGKAILILILGWLISKWGRRITRKAFAFRNLDPVLGGFIGSLVQYAILAATVITSLGAVGIQTTSLVAIFASAGLAIGLALQGSLGNFASGVLILFFRPFNLGNKVTAGGHTGKVEDIGLFATTLLTPSNERIMIPNSAIMSNPITNFSATGTLRATIEVGVAYGSDVEKVRATLLKAVLSVPQILSDPEPKVHFNGLGASSLDFWLLVWSDTADFFDMQNHVRTAVYNELNAANIEIPFNQIVVHQAQA
ncbi:MAG: mechanosensitive ion channel [Acidobacteria bacterium]|nr:mechanosensitive ion channel [Acidobacteriota bacterium]MCB9398412.1 mechanosensitive ion channel [Acidobacteriota bacterium]